jgi:2-(1,2-epoxy-1,2-dihydrophenyl)acetyl-CoA isomerase
MRSSPPLRPREPSEGEMTDTAYATLELERRDGSGWITLNRPDRLNALTGEMYLELERCAAELQADPSVGAIVVTGKGRAFSAGADLQSYSGEVDMTDPHSIRDRMRLIGRVVRAWTNLDKPTIAAVNGVAVGGGANLALMCDLVLMREDARISQNYAKIGVVPDMGGTYFLPRLVGRARSMELALLGDMITAAEAERIGMVNRCIPVERFDEEVREYAKRVSSIAPRVAELILTGLRHAPVMDLDTTLEWEANAIAMAVSTREARDAFAAFKNQKTS